MLSPPPTPPPAAAANAAAARNNDSGGGGGGGSSFWGSLLQPRGTAAAVAAVASARSRSNNAGGGESGEDDGEGGDGGDGGEGGEEGGLSDLDSGDSASAPSSVIDEEETQELIEEMAAILNEKETGISVQGGSSGGFFGSHQSRSAAAAGAGAGAALSTTTATATATTATSLPLPRSVSVSVAARRPDIGHTEYEIREVREEKEGEGEAAPLLAVVRFKEIAALGEKMRRQLRGTYSSSLPGASAWAALEASKAARGGARLAGPVVAARRLAMEEGLNACLLAAAAVPAAADAEATPTALLPVRQLLSSFLFPSRFSSPSPPPPPSRMRLLVEPLPDPPPSDSELLSAQRGACPSCGERLGLPVAAAPPTLLLSSPPRGTASASASIRCEYCVALQCHRCCSRKAKTALPRLVVTSFDFSRRPVCDAAAEFLEGIRPTPLLLIPSAPSSQSSSPSTGDLYSRVPSLGAAREARARASAAVAAAAASSAPASKTSSPAAAPSSVAAALLAAAARAGRGHLLRRGEEDWWSLAELEDDLHSKGAFASLPGWLEAVAAKANGALAGKR